MKIYQIHEHTGDYEDYRDYIVGSYLKKERAEEEKTKLELKEKELSNQSKKCRDCPFLEEGMANISRLMSKYPNYCPDAKLEELNEYGIVCENYYIHWYESTFNIEEVEVEE